MGTLRCLFKAVAHGGKIALDGVLANADEAPSTYPMVRKGDCPCGIFVGDRAMFGAMNSAIQVNDLMPVTDGASPFEDAADVYRYQYEGAYFGEVVVSIRALCVCL